MRRALVFGLLVSLGLAGCAAPGSDYRHNRFDYWAFRARVGRLPEPNYLPYLLHRERLPGGGEGYVACRWAPEDFPLRYYVSAPSIPNDLQDEFNPRDPEDYPAAVARAFDRWAEELGRPVRFERVLDPADARVHVRLVAGREVRDGKTLGGRVADIAGRCRVTGPGDDPGRVQVVFEVPETTLFVADMMGLLTPRQVFSLALHEIGHVLGASGQHSPLRGDAMYAIADDSRVDAISEHDRNSFRALYRLRPGAVYARPDPLYAEPEREIRVGPPVLDRRMTEERFGFSVSFPKGWQIVRQPRGFIAVDGVTWDYDASIQVIVARGEVEAFATRQQQALEARGRLVSQDQLEIDGISVRQLVARADSYTEQTTILPMTDGLILLVIADCATRDFELYTAWFQRVVLSLDPAS